jgi:hypothetical protein
VRVCVRERETARTTERRAREEEGRKPLRHLKREGGREGGSGRLGVGGDSESLPERKQVLSWTLIKSSPFHRACAPSGRCPQCAQPSLVPFSALTRGCSRSGVRADLVAGACVVGAVPPSSWGNAASGQQGEICRGEEEEGHQFQKSLPWVVNRRGTKRRGINFRNPFHGWSTGSHQPWLSDILLLLVISRHRSDDRVLLPSLLCSENLRAHITNSYSLREIIPFHTQSSCIVELSSSREHISLRLNNATLRM